MIELYTLPASECARWDTFVGESPEGSIFQTSTWIDIFCTVFGYSSEILTAVSGDTIMGGVVLFRKKHFGIHAIITPPMIPYNGVMFAPSGSRKAQRELKDNLEILSLFLPAIEQKAHYIALTHSPMLVDMRSFQWRNWNVSLRYTFLNHLTDLDKTFSALSHGARRRIRKAEDEGITCVQIHDCNTVTLLQEESYIHSGIKPPVKNEILNKLCAGLITTGNLRFFGAIMPDGTVSAAQAVITSGPSAYLWFFGRRTVNDQENGSSFLMWAIFNRLATEGVRTIDLIGANTPSIAEYKSSFGGSLANYSIVSRYKSPAIKAIIGANNILHRLRRKL